jgi:hypothetical protein
MTLEQEVRVDPARRADRFVADWQSLQHRRRSLEHVGDDAGAQRINSRMQGMAKRLERDPQVESLLRNRRLDLGISGSAGASLSHDLQDSLGLSRSRGLGR